MFLVEAKRVKNTQSNITIRTNTNIGQHFQLKVFQIEFMNFEISEFSYFVNLLVVY